MKLKKKNERIVFVMALSIFVPFDKETLANMKHYSKKYA